MKEEWHEQYYAKRRADGRAEIVIPKRVVAEQLWEAQRVVGRAEERLINVLTYAFGDGWDDYSSDHYDCSIEVFGSNLTNPEAPAILKQAGFVIAWLHKPECEMPRGNGCKCQAIGL